MELVTKEELLQDQFAAATEEPGQRGEGEVEQLEHRNKVADLTGLSFATHRRGESTPPLQHP